MPNELQTKTSTSLKEIITELEKKMILEAMDSVGGNQTKAARRLGISQRVMGYKLKKYKITIKPKRGGENDEKVNQNY